MITRDILQGPDYENYACKDFDSVTPKEEKKQRQQNVKVFFYGECPKVPGK